MSVAASPSPSLVSGSKLLVPSVKVPELKVTTPAKLCPRAAASIVRETLVDSDTVSIAFHLRT